MSLEKGGIATNWRGYYSMCGFANVQMNKVFNVVVNKAYV